jgi:hypothetical protein
MISHVCLFISMLTLFFFSIKSEISHTEVMIESLAGSCDLLYMCDFNQDECRNLIANNIYVYPKKVDYGRKFQDPNCGF